MDWFVKALLIVLGIVISAAVLFVLRDYHNDTDYHKRI